MIQPSNFNDSSGAQLRRTAAFGSFEQALVRQVLYSGLLADEYADESGGNFPQDRRVQLASDQGYPYATLSQARVDALRAIYALRTYDTSSAHSVSELYSFVGFIETIFVENLCSGVPLASVVKGVPQYGPTVTRDSLIRVAISHFDTAQTYAGTSDSLVHLAAVGLGRLLLDSGAYAHAMTVVAQVPANFSYAMTYSGSGAYPSNLIYPVAYQGLAVSVSDREGINGLPFVSAQDPRVPIDSVGTSSNTNVPVYAFRNYNQLTAPILLATGVEARLIAAESSLPINGGAGTTWLDTLNALRSRSGFPGLMSAPLSDPGDDGARLNLLMSERAFWLFATGHRMGDLRRLVRFYGRSTDSVYPAGPYEGSATTYGSGTVYEPYDEQFNPNFHGCVDRQP